MSRSCLEFEKRTNQSNTPKTTISTASLKKADQAGNQRVLKIWGRANSINVQKVLWCCEELKLSYQKIQAGGAFGITDTPQYLSINPNGLVPTLEDNGFYLWESNVVVRYLAQKYGSGDFCPTQINRRFDAERWMDWQVTSLWPALRIVFIALIRTPDDQRDLGALRQAEAQCARYMSVLDKALADRKFIAGDEFSMGDIPVGTAAHRWYALDIPHQELHHLSRWYSGLCSRESFRKTVMLPLS